MTTALLALDRVDVPHPAYDRVKAKRLRVRRVYEGVDALAENAEDYFTLLDDETAPQLAARVRLAEVHPGLEQTVGASKGMILQDGPGFEADMPPSLVKFAEDVDGAGTHLAVFADTLLENALVDGLAGIFVEHATLPDPTKQYSPDELRAIGHSPYWILVRAEDVFKPYYANINGKQTLVLFVRREVIEELQGDFAVVTVTQYRVYRRVQTSPGVFSAAIESSLWKVPDIGGDPVKDETSVRTLRKMSRIPWAPLPTGRRISAAEVWPPFLTLAGIILQYHRTLTGILNLQDKACNAPTLVLLGRPDADRGKKVKLGPRQVIDAPSATKGGTDTPAFWLQLNTDACAPAEKSLDRAESMMGVAFGSFLGLQPAGVESAKAKQIREKGGSATLAGVGRATKDCFELAFSYTGEYTGEVSGRVNVKTDFTDVMMDAPVMMAYIELKKSGFPPMPILIALQKAGRIPPDQNLQELADDWDAMSDAMDQVKALTTQLKTQPPKVPAAA